MHLATKDQLLKCLREQPQRVLRITSNADYVVEDDAAHIATVDFDAAQKVVEDGNFIDPKENCGTWGLRE